MIAYTNGSDRGPNGFHDTGPLMPTDSRVHAGAADCDHRFVRQVEITCADVFVRVAQPRVRHRDSNLELGRFSKVDFDDLPVLPGTETHCCLRSVSHDAI